MVKFRRIHNWAVSVALMAMEAKHYCVTRDVVSHRGQDVFHFTIILFSDATNIFLRRGTTIHDYSQVIN